MSSFGINLAVLNQGCNNLNNSDQTGEILYAIGHTVSDPDYEPIEYKQSYFHCKSTFNKIQAWTDETKFKENEMPYAKLEYNIVCYYSYDVGGINRNEVRAGDYIAIDNETNLWYKIIKVIEHMANQYTVVKAIQTSEDPEKPNINATEGGGVNNRNLMWNPPI